MVLYFWNGYFTQKVCYTLDHQSFFQSLSSSPCVPLAYHNSLFEKESILAETFANFLLTVVKSDPFQLLACQKGEDFEKEDEVTQMSTRYWAFFLFQVARLDTMVSF
jgi:hypothetical protein